MRESEKAIVVPPRDRIDVWWNLATELGGREPGLTEDQSVFSLDGADDLIDALPAPSRTGGRDDKYCGLGIEDGSVRKMSLPGQAIRLPLLKAAYIP